MLLTIAIFQSEGERDWIKLLENEGGEVEGIERLMPLSRQSLVFLIA